MALDILKHVHLSFFSGRTFKGSQKKFLQKVKTNLHNGGIKFRNLEEIDEKTLIAYIREAVANNKKRIQVPSKEKKEVAVPSDFLKALKLNKLEQKFNDLAYTYRKEYVNWM